MSDESVPPGWQSRKRPSRLERRLEFSDYDATRDFLDAVAELCEAVGFYPDISFGRTYANITIHAEDGASEVGPERAEVARGISTLIDSKTDSASG